MRKPQLNRLAWAQSGALCCLVRTQRLYCRPLKKAGLRQDAFFTILQDILRDSARRTTMSDENKALIRRWFDEVWNRRLVASIDQLLAHDAVIHGLGPDLRGPDGFKTFYTAYCNAFPDVSIHLDALVAEGDLVAVRWSATGTHRGDGLGFAATGRPVRLNGMVFARVKSGKLIEGWNNFDQFGMFQQLGVVALPGG
jgi:steroid delta-isomerase-like uncharacterized protein